MTCICSYFFKINTHLFPTISLKVNSIGHLSFFFCLGFLSRTFMIHSTAGERGVYLFHSSVPLPPASQTLRQQPGDYCKELTSSLSQQLDLNPEPLVSELKLLTTKLRALRKSSWDTLIFIFMSHGSIFGSKNFSSTNLHPFDTKFIDNVRVTQLKWEICKH